MYKKIKFNKLVKITMENVFSSQWKTFTFTKDEEIVGRVDKSPRGFNWLVTEDGWGGRLYNKQDVQIN